MLITVNGREMEVAEAISLPHFLEWRGVQLRQIAVAVNGEVVNRDAYAAVTLRERDIVEIVRMVGGG